MDIQFIENYLQKFDRIIVFDSTEQEKVNLWNRFLDSKILKQCEKQRILLLSNTTKTYGGDNVIAISLDEDEKKKLYRLYRLYEFTDKIIWISDENQYPSLLNYINSGIMTEEDLFYILVYEG